MIQGIPTAAILTPTSDENTTQPRWAFLFNTISHITSAKLNYLGFAYMLIGAVSIGCEAYLIKTADKGFHSAGQPYSQIFGIQLFAFGLVVILLRCNQVFVLTAIFILGFYQLISLIRTIVLYSISLALLIEACNDDPIACVTLTIKALIVTCLICALFSFILVWENLIVIAKECQPLTKLALPTQPISVAYINQAHIPHTQ